MRLLVIFCAALAMGSSGAVFSQPLGTGFSIQGELQNAGLVVDGQVEFEFEPFDAAVGGNSLAPQEARSLILADGVFSTELDFGDAPFVGETVWLEVRVRQQGGSFTTLLPRQAITPAPYALHAQFVGMDAVTGSEIANGSIQSADLGNGSVGSSQINSAQVQRRIASICPIGSAIREVAEDGGVICQSPDADDDWLPLGDGRLENTTGIRVQPAAGTLFPFSI